MTLARTSGIIRKMRSLLALLLLAASLFRRLVGPEAAPVATLFFGLSHANVAAYAWPSAAHVVIGGDFNSYPTDRGYEIMAFPPEGQPYLVASGRSPGSTGSVTAAASG